jgi:hypothetical protein
MQLRISENRRFIVKADGTPFFYLGDTAWELFHRLDRDEAAHYLRTRAQQRFTVIQAVALAEFDGLRTPNAYGHVPFCDLDPTQPNEDYFKHVDWVVERAAAEGLITGLLPTWGDKVNMAWGKGPAVFNPENARAYGRFLGRRYRDLPLIWILGGDRRLETGPHLLTYRAMAQGIRDGGATQLMTFHPMGGLSSSHTVHSEDWLDFNMLQSGHDGRDKPNWNMVDLDRARQPVKPVLDGEPNYEDHPVMAPDWKSADGWFDEYDVRKQAWRSLLAGACGHTYGCHDIWQMYDERREPINRARTPWRVALELPGARQMQHVRAFFESRAWLKLVPDQALVRSEIGSGGAHIRAARAQDKSYTYVYLPQGGTVQLDIQRLNSTMRVQWFDPRTGAARGGGLLTENGTLTAPSTEDWVLVLGA